MADPRVVVSRINQDTGAGKNPNTNQNHLERHRATVDKERKRQTFNQIRIRQSKTHLRSVPIRTPSAVRQKAELRSVVLSHRRAILLLTFLHYIRR